MSDFEVYSKEIEEATNSILLKEALKTERKGSARLRDRIVVGKVSWGEALTYVSIIQSIVIFMALIPEAVVTINEFLDWLGIDYRFPVQVSSVGAVMFIIFVFIFGLVAVRHIGTSRRGYEISSKMTPGTFLMWKQMKGLEKKLNDLDEKIK